MTASDKVSLSPGAPAAGHASSRYAIIATIGVISATVLILFALGRSWWCHCTTPHLWVGNIWSTHNSQHVLDPYAFSHVQHGLILYLLLAVVVPRLSRATRALIALTIECGWEIVENTSWIIDKYRDSTASLDYFGDSIVNSLADIGACGLGFGLAAIIPTTASVTGFIAIEAVMLLAIRDSLLLNVLMLLHPLDAIKQWQLG